MDPLTAADVRKIARLSKLDLTDAECEAERPRLAAVLGYFERLQELALDDAEPLAHVGDEPARLRDDVPGETLPPGRLAETAPAVFEAVDAEGNAEIFLRVPKVIGDTPAPGDNA